MKRLFVMILLSLLVFLWACSQTKDHGNIIEVILDPSERKEFFIDNPAFSIQWNLVSFEKDTDETHYSKEFLPGIADEIYLASHVPDNMEFYHILWTWDVELLENILRYPVYTNDPSWEIESLPFIITEKDMTTYKGFYWDGSWEEWMDGTHLFLGYWNEAMPITKFSNYIPLQVLGEQAAMGLVGYSDGYLLLFPFTFPVDKDSFKTVQRKDQFKYWEVQNISDLKEVSGWLRRPRFVNDGIVYYKYLGDDKDWVYVRMSVDWGVRIVRIAKAPDFKFLPMQGGENPDLMIIGDEMVEY